MKAILGMIDNVLIDGNKCPIHLIVLERGEVDGYAGDKVVLANLKLRSPNPAHTETLGRFTMAKANEISATEMNGWSGLV